MIESSLNNFLIVKKEVIKEQRSNGGIIINVSSEFDFKDKFSKKNTCTATVINENESIPYLKSGDRIVMNPTNGSIASIDYEDFTVITKDQYIAKIEEDGRFIVPPDCVMVKIRKEDTEALYSKWITKFDGTRVQLFIQAEPDRDTDRRSKVFVSFGEIVQIGSEVKGIEVGDIGILDYTVDNELDNILYYDEDKNKYIVIGAITTFHEKDEWAYANRNNPKDAKISSKGEMDKVSSLLGLLRGDRLIARRPYVFINHLPSKVSRETIAGIVYMEDQCVMKRNILSVSDESKKRIGMSDGDTIVVEDFDIFDIKLPNGAYIQCILDVDILMKVDESTVIK